jgi:hypothetical protein
VGAIYRHPNQNLDIFTDALQTIFSKICKLKCPCILAGDTNINLLKVESNAPTEHYLNNLLLHNFMPLILLPTRITNKSATLIDHIYYNEGRYAKKQLNIYSGNILSDISDHLPNFIILSNSIKKHEINNRPLIRLYSAKNKTQFNNCLASIDWSMILHSCNDVNVCFNRFISILQDTFESCFPLIRQSRKAHKDKDWITTGIKASSKHKDYLFQKWQITKNDSDEMSYRSYKKIYSVVLKKAQMMYYNKLFDNKNNSIKKLWSNLNKICSNSKNSNVKNKIDKIVDDCGREITSCSDISNCFNEYFCSVGSNLFKKIPVISKHFSEYLNKPVTKSIYVEDVTAHEVFNLIKSLKSNKSSGPDGLNCGLLKENAYLLCGPLSYMYNLSLISGIVPDKFKIAKVVPIFKKGSTTQLGNYRPISLLSIFNKLLEKVVYSRLINFLTKNNIIYKYQFGFRKNYSTSLALLDVLDMCYNNIDNSNKVVGIFLDLQKAFDSVDHQILLYKIQYYGIRGFMFDWLKNYLSDRKQYTVVNNVSSNIGSINYGVPQGSVLGPLLFLLYMNDISNAVPENDIKLFADDTNIFIFGPTFSVIEKQANICLKKLELWFNANKLSINIDKTYYTVFNCKTKDDVTLNLLINGQQIDKVSSIKYLGVFIDERFNWTVHIDHVFSKIVKFTSLFYKLKTVVPKHCLSKLYYAFVFPYINYGVEVYANCSNSALDKLNKLNNKLLRILLDRNYTTPNIELYRLFNVLPIDLLHEMKLLEIVHKYYYHKDLLPEIFQEYFLPNYTIHQYNTRNKLDLHMSAVNSSFGQRRCVFRGSKYWNELPSYLKSISSTFLFKNNIKHYLLWR